MVDAMFCNLKRRRGESVRRTSSFLGEKSLCVCMRVCIFFYFPGEAYFLASQSRRELISRYNKPLKTYQQRTLWDKRGEPKSLEKAEVPSAQETAGGQFYLSICCVPAEMGLHLETSGFWKRELSWPISVGSPRTCIRYLNRGGGVNQPGVGWVSLPVFEQRSFALSGLELANPGSWDSIPASPPYSGS